MKSVISTPLMKEQMKRIWPMVLLTFLGYGLALLLPIFLQTGGADSVVRAQRMIDLLAMRQPIMLVSMIMIPVVVILLLFSHLFDSKAMSAYSSFSDNKNQLFWTSALSGWLVMVLPLLAMSALLLIRVRYSGSVDVLEFPTALFSRGIVSGEVINTFSVVAMFFLRSLIIVTFYFSLFLLAVTVSGNWVIASLLFAIFPFIPTLIHRLIQTIAAMYVFGYVPVNPLDSQVIFTYSNPIAWFWSFGQNAQPIFLLIYISMTLVILFLAYLSFTQRKVEKTEEPIVFTNFKHLLIFLLSVAGMLAMGAYLMDFFSGRWFMYYGFVIGFSFTFVIAQMIVKKTFNVITEVKWLMPMMGIVLSLYGVMLLVTNFGVRTYTNHVPAVSQVEGIYVSHEGQMKGNDFSTDDQMIQDTINLHHQIIGTRSVTGRDWRDLSRNERRDIRSDEREHRKNMQEAFWQSITGNGERFIENGGEHIYITYLLSDNERIHRRYALTGTFVSAMAESE
ncbi:MULTISPECIES: hypothetical protein [unclassified Enterococcus]|uniref:hypothetical protein n=1 Tax=unclassified Enterococcus TaxID=2608891 RepID=UPI001A9C1FCE|nr:hypothetical protein [Enterococcus sp. DIV1271a]MBO1299294.1 hypothetical protein [Enterococcus sp. DIV1271a]